MPSLPFAPEYIWLVLLAVLLLGIAYGALRDKTRDKRMDGVTEAATKKVMDDPGPEPMKGDRPQPPGGLPPRAPG
jgi:hypothetical protein